MAGGLSSHIDSLQVRLIQRWVPKWHDAFTDRTLGGYYERLNRNFKPILTGQRRLVSQCRQLSIYSHWAAHNQKSNVSVRNQFEFIVERYHHAQAGHWWFSIDDSGNVKDRHSDLYALAFVIFSFSHYYRVNQDARAKDLAMQVLAFINDKFRIPGLPGFAEAVGDEGRPMQKMRRQNPHMHLLEACLFAYETWGDSAYLSMADEIVELFARYFYDTHNHVVREFFNDDLSLHPAEGHKVEPGHAFEWVWLLKKHGAAHGDSSRHDVIALHLLENANRSGWDHDHGGIYDVVDERGAVIAPTKRIWPFCEALKANVLMLNTAPDRQAIKDRVFEMIRVFNERYMQERGFWSEWLERDFTPVTDYMPATTPYHVYFGVMETAEAVDKRGGSKSLAGGVVSVLYTLRRQISQSVKRLRLVVQS